MFGQNFNDPGGGLYIWEINSPGKGSPAYGGQKGLGEQQQAGTVPCPGEFPAPGGGGGCSAPVEGLEGPLRLLGPGCDWRAQLHKQSQHYI